MDNRRLDLWTWCSWLLFGWCIFHTVVQLIFEIHACCNAREEYERVEDGKYNAEAEADRRQRRERASVSDIGVVFRSFVRRKTIFLF